MKNSFIETMTVISDETQLEDTFSKRHVRRKYSDLSIENT